jgi:hypothetical protein
MPRGWRLHLMVALLIIVPAPAPVGAAGSGVAHAGGATAPTLAIEDTLSTEISEILVRAPRVTLSEILDRVARGEARRDSLIHDEAFRLTVRVVRNPASAKPVVMQENVYQAYKRRPSSSRLVTLREYSEKPEKGDDMQIDLGPDFSEEIVNFAFRPAARRDFTYRIVSRDLVGGHLVYRIAFQPRSRLDPSMPSGLVWIDTNEFVILRQEVMFERSPVPVLIKAVDRMVVERRRAGDLWVLSRLLMRASFTVPLPKVGRAFDVALLFDDYHVNEGIPDSIFAGASAHGTTR